jgi:hypothetical protein
MRKYTVLSVVVAGVAIFGLSCGRDRPVSDPVAALLNEGLVPVYRAVAGGEPESEIVGQRLDVTLGLRICTERRILFEDEMVVVDEDTKYHFVKWTFDQVVIGEFIGKAGVRCRVKGVITEVRRGETTPGMPYIVAELESIALQP